MARAIREEKEEAAADLREIQQKMFDLLGEAEEIIHQVESAGLCATRAKSYWIPAIESALDHNRGNKYDTSMQSTIDELETPACTICGGEDVKKVSFEDGDHWYCEDCDQTFDPTADSGVVEQSRAA